MYMRSHLHDMELTRKAFTEVQLRYGMQDICSIDYEDWSTCSRICWKLKGCMGDLFSLCYLSWSQWRGIKHITKTRIQHTAPSALSLSSPLKHWSGTQILCAPSTSADWELQTLFCSLNNRVSGSFSDWSFSGLLNNRAKQTGDSPPAAAVDRSWHLKILRRGQTTNHWGNWPVWFCQNLSYTFNLL